MSVNEKVGWWCAGAAGGVLFVLAGGVELLGVMGVVGCIVIAFIVSVIVERM